MTNKEKVVSILTRLKIENNKLDNALMWEFSQKDIRYIQTRINNLENELVAMIPD